MLKPHASSRRAERSSADAQTTSPLAAMSSESDAMAESPRSTAIYIAQMTVELGKLARATQFEMLTYLLDLARLEAELRVGRPERRRALPATPN